MHTIGKENSELEKQTNFTCTFSNFFPCFPLQVYGGVYRQKSLGQSHAARKLIEIHVHPGYEAASFDNDIAIAKVDRPFPSNSFTSTVCLPKEVIPNDETLPKVGEKCFAIGWGKIRESVGPVADTLQEVEVPIQEKCKNNEIQICGGFEAGGKDACEGKTGNSFFHDLCFE